VRAFRERLKLEVDRMRRHKKPLSLLYVDLDDFKRVNDQRGHGAGDETLVRVGRLLNALTRKVDLCGRVGGDEFAVLMPETNAQEALVVAHRVREGMLKSFAEGGAGATKFDTIHFTPLGCRIVAAEVLRILGDYGLVEMAEAG